MGIPGSWVFTLYRASVKTALPAIGKNTELVVLNVIMWAEKFNIQSCVGKNTDHPFVENHLNFF